MSLRKQWKDRILNQNLLPNQFEATPTPEIQAGKKGVEFDFIAWEVELEGVDTATADWAPRTSTLSPDCDDIVFDFDAWEAELEDVDLEEQARLAFDGLLTFETEDEGKTRTISDIKNDIVTFMSNPEIIQMQNMIEYAAVQFAQFCSHNHIGGDSIGDSLSGLFDMGQSLLGEKTHSHDDHHEHDLLGHDEDDEEDEPDGKKKKKKRRR